MKEMEIVRLIRETMSGGEAGNCCHLGGFSILALHVICICIFSV